MRAPLICLPAMALFACAEPAQEPQRAAPTAARPPDPPPPSPLEQPPRPPRPGDPSPVHQTYYETRYGVSRAEGQRRQANEQHVSDLGRRLGERRLFGYSSIRIEHEPYAVVVAFKQAPDRAAILALAHPSLRGDLRFEQARRTAGEIDRDGDRIVAALQGIGPGWAGGYDVFSQKFEYNFRSPQAVREAERRIPPDLRGDVVLKVGSVPMPLSR